MQSNLSIPTGWRAWADGSSLSNPGPAGWAILVQRPDGTGYTVHGNSGSETRTNNEAELHALLKAVKAMPQDCPAVIYSDSEYSINAATKYRARWEANGMRGSDGKAVKNSERIRKLWAALDERPRVRLEWVKGHDKNEGNHVVDALARGAAEAAKAGRSINARVHETL